jgi:outer membrane immunogenic protein
MTSQEVIEMTLTRTLALAAIGLAGFSGSALAADLYVPPAQPAPVAQAPAATDWDGPYVGASVGYGWGTATDTTVAPNDSTNLTGYFVGGQIGYNFHLTNNVVAGVEGDLNWNNQSGTFAGAAPDTFRINWDGSVRGRLGLDVDGILPYAEAGVAFANATDSIGGGVTNTQTGWTAGAGIEFKVADPVSLNVEYRYTDYGSATYGADSVGVTNNTVRGGVNYHF